MIKTRRTLPLWYAWIEQWAEDLGAPVSEGSLGGVSLSPGPYNGWIHPWVTKYLVTMQLSSASLTWIPSHERLKNDVTLRTKMTDDTNVTSFCGVIKYATTLSKRYKERVPPISCKIRRKMPIVISKRCLTYCNYRQNSNIHIIHTNNSNGIWISGDILLVTFDR